jgi:hypothetical protein
VGVALEADRAYAFANPLVEATMERSEPTAAPLNRLRAVWRDGRCALGAIVTIPSVQLIQVMARSGLDCRADQWCRSKGP